MDVGSMLAPPSPDKEEEASRVVELAAYELSPEKEMDVLDLTHIDWDFEPEESFADELAELEVRFAESAVGLPKLMRGDDGKMMELVPHELIRELMKSPPCSSPFLDYSAEAIGHRGITDEGLEIVIKGFRAMEEAQDIENDIIRRYRDKGYAYVDLPDDDYEN